MNASGYTFLGLTLVVALLLGILAVALVRFRGAAREARRRTSGGGDAVMLSAALQEALSRVKAEERAMSARATASEQLSALVFDSLTAGLIVVDASELVRIVNPAACRMLGLGEPAPDAPYRDVLAGASPLADVVAEGLRTQTAIVRRALPVQCGGRSWHFGVTVSPFAGGSGPGVICLFSDLTTIVELEVQLHLKDALARLGELTAGIAHEFRNGLATIHGYSRLFDPDALPPRYRPYVEGIRQETDTLGKMVTNFLAFARPETVTLLPVDLGAVARRAADDLRVDLPAETTFAIGGTFGAIRGDDVLLRQAFGNLIRNAAEACVSVDRAPAIVIAGRVDPAQRMVLVSVEDNGPGIPEEDRARVFQPFFTRRSRGSGLGLAIVQKIVLLHNGRVAVTPTASGGARIDVAFPLAEAETAGEAA